MSARPKRSVRSEVGSTATVNEERGSTTTWLPSTSPSSRASAAPTPTTPPADGAAPCAASTSNSSAVASYAGNNVPGADESATVVGLPSPPAPSTSCWRASRRQASASMPGPERATVTHPPSVICATRCVRARRASLPSSTVPAPTPNAITATSSRAPTGAATTLRVASPTSAARRQRGALIAHPPDRRRARARGRRPPPRRDRGWRSAPRAEDRPRDR